MPAQDWQISAADRPIIEQSVGAAVIDKLRGHTASLTQMYDLYGGVDSGTKEALASYEPALDALDGSKHSDLMGGTWLDKFGAWNLSQRENTLVARAVGAARLAQAEGTSPTTALEHYQRLGGENPTTVDSLTKLSA